MLQMLKTTNLALSFFLELIMLAAFSYWGFYGEKSIWIKWLLGIGIPLMVAIVWGLYLAPNSKRRLNITAGGIVSSVLFLGAAIALYQTGYSALAIILAIIMIFNRISSLLWKQW